MSKPQFIAPAPEDSPEVFRTPSGSRLYGIAHARSDHDIFVVTTSRLRMTSQTVSEDGSLDFTYRGVEEFLERAKTGSHQACEAAFSREKVFTEIGDAWRPMIESLRVTGTEAMARYERTIASFSFGDFKRRRHAVRLSFNLADLRMDGRFEPRMTDAQIERANALATETKDFDLARLLLPGKDIDFDERRIRFLRKRFGVDVLA